MSTVSLYDVFEMKSLVSQRSKVYEFGRSVKTVSSWDLKKPAPLIPSEMTDEELSHLRFTTFSKEDEEAIMAELKKRGLAL